LKHSDYNKIISYDVGPVDKPTIAPESSAQSFDMSCGGIAPGLFPRHRDLVFSFSPRRFRRLKAVLTGRAAIDHKWTEILGHQI
jgi:hypothetical protein